MDVISTDHAPAAVGPYSQGIKAGNFIFTAMQIALDPSTGELKGSTAAEQVKQCLLNVKAIVEAGGGAMDKIVKTMVYLADIKEFGPVNEVYSEFFSGPPPARGVAEVSALPKGALVAVEAIAFLD